ncbi:MAG: NAD(P)H-binding protein [Rhodospirillaceae bacterium]|nr:NAD(P)H-binding protein [Rhodospirillaceae bacterium]
MLPALRPLLAAFSIAISVFAPMMAAAKDNGGVIVFGGTGRLGVDIVRLLVDAGEDVTVFSRTGDAGKHFKDMKVRIAVGDLLDDASIGKAFDARSYRVAIDAAAQRTEIRLPDFYEKVTRSIVRHAKRTGVKHFISHGSIGAGDNHKMVPALASYPQTAALIDKGKAEALIIAGGVPYTIIRNGVLPNTEPLPPATHKAGLTVDYTTFSAITRADLAILTLDCIDNPARLNRIYHAIDATLPIPTE